MNGVFEHGSLMESRAWSLGPLSQNLSHLMLSKNATKSTNSAMLDEILNPYSRHSREMSNKNFSFLTRNNI